MRPGPPGRQVQFLNHLAEWEFSILPTAADFLGEQCSTPTSASEALRMLRSCVQNVPFMREATDEAARHQCEQFQPDSDLLVYEEISLVTRGYRRPNIGGPLGDQVLR